MSDNNLKKHVLVTNELTLADNGEKVTEAKIRDGLGCVFGGIVSEAAQAAECDFLLTVFVEKLPSQAILSLDGHRIFVCVRKAEAFKSHKFMGLPKPTGDKAKRAQGAYQDEQGTVRWVHDDSDASRSPLSDFEFCVVCGRPMGTEQRRNFYNRSGLSAFFSLKLTEYICTDCSENAVDELVINMLLYYRMRPWWYQNKHSHKRNYLIEDIREAALEACQDWREGRAYIDNHGNYRYRKGGRITPWNKAAKCAFFDVEHLHKYATGTNLKYEELDDYFEERSDFVRESAITTQEEEGEDEL